MGRHSKIEELSDEAKKRVVALLRNGSPQNWACREIGISYDTLLNWRKLAKEGDARYVDFIADVEQAEATYACESLAIISSAGKEDWKARAWMLEKLHPKDFAPVQKQE